MMMPVHVLEYVRNVLKLSASCLTGASRRSRRALLDFMHTGATHALRVHAVELGQGAIDSMVHGTVVRL